VVSDVEASGIGALAAELNTTRPNSVLAVVADVASEQGNKELVVSARQFLSQDGHSGIDLFFANAGVGSGTLLETTPEAEWDLAFNVNVHAHRWAAKYLLDDWLAAGQGYFCSTASAAGLLSQIGSIPYSVTKSAAVAFAESLSITYGDRGLRVSCLCPQGVNTNMLRQGDSPGVGIASNVVRAAGVVLEPEDVALFVSDAIENERFLILPHPQVAEFEQRKAADRDRWLTGMRKLQARVFGNS
jgi:NAD(P)-dependent dehydrogenase (short-subunit alcohol dehydrogenase family)